MTRLRANQDQHSSVLVQSVVERVVGAGGREGLDGGLEAIADRARTRYALRADLLVHLLETGVPGGVRIERAHRRDLPVGAGAGRRDRPRRGARLARERFGTDMALGRYFFLAGDDEDHGRLRVGISHLDEAALTDGAERLIAALTAPEARR
ncbi:hypothetical protein [Brachybacterium sp. GPGPB12]|uniref:hypothetical protein n=1 Tax=Brachybacterium sp. GPGPB12 TaxID=3023517 RepID=UPI0031346431